MILTDARLVGNDRRVQLLSCQASPAFGTAGTSRWGAQFAFFLKLFLSRDLSALQRDGSVVALRVIEFRVPTAKSSHRWEWAGRDTSFDSALSDYVTESRTVDGAPRLRRIARPS